MSSRKATAAEIVTLRARVEELHNHIALSRQMEKPSLEALFQRELGAKLVRLSELELQCEPRARVRTPKPKPAPCPWAASIRRFFAVAIDAGLNPRNDTGMRRAFENFLCRPVSSRADLTGADWDAAAAAVESKRLAW